MVIFSAIGVSFAQNRFNAYTPDAEKFPKVRSFYEAADINNVPIPGLSAGDFKVVENGIPFLLPTLLKSVLPSLMVQN